MLDHHGIWKVAGMSGVIYGLDLREALLTLPRGIDREFARDLLLKCENAFVIAWNKAREQDK